MLGVEAGRPSLRIEADGATLGMAATDQSDASFLVAREQCRCPPLPIGLLGVSHLSARVLER